MHRLLIPLACMVLGLSSAFAQMTIDRADIENRVDLLIESFSWDANDNVSGSRMPDTAGLAAILRGGAADFRSIVKDLKKNAGTTMKRLAADVPAVDSFPAATHVELTTLFDAGGAQDSIFYRFAALSDNAFTILGAVFQFDFDENGTDDTLVTRYNPNGWMEGDLPVGAGKSWQNAFTQETWVTIPGFGSVLTRGPTEQREYEAIRATTLTTPAGAVPAIVLRVFEFITHEQGGVDIALERFSFIAENGLAVTGSYTIDKQSRERIALNDVAYFVPEGSSGVQTMDDWEGAGGVDLQANRPNPFTDRTDIPFSLEKNGHVRLTVHDALGREVAVLMDGAVAAGDHIAEFQSRALPAGMYTCQLQVGEVTLSRKMMLRR